ncbi:hypothetical protein J4467_01060 [Candidatus Woesearchaeota archaeon]|nr:hypothetical protein [Candidatus Woesearchaeota archaeon]
MKFLLWIKKLFTPTWKRIEDIPYWIQNAHYKNPNKVYYKGKTFIYKLIDKPGKQQGEHIYTLYRKERKF